MIEKIGLGDLQYAIKEHLATRHHWDIRLQVFEKLVLSWAVHCAPHLNPSSPLKARRTGDHELAYLLSERLIFATESVVKPGPVAVWDYGIYRMLGGSTIQKQLNSGCLRLEMWGKRLRGRFSMKWIGPQVEDWLWSKESDEFADYNHRFPDVLTPEKIHELELKSLPKRNINQMMLFK